MNDQLEALGQIGIMNFTVFTEKKTTGQFFGFQKLNLIYLSLFLQDNQDLFKGTNWILHNEHEKTVT